ncbi:MAG: TonB-dependent receptor [Holophagales bacterium]|nr:MAG: TonB-dependent receptor [Holophagales bacterium]
MKRGQYGFVLANVALLLVLALTFAGAAGAQKTNASIRGVIKDSTGPIPAAKVTAVDAQSGFQHAVTTGPDGSFMLAGLKPGTYAIKVSSEAYNEQSRTVTLLLGQDVQADFVLSPTEVYVEGVTVVGDASPTLLETRSSEISTNITTQQIENLPQNNRNFLAFAGLAPGVQFTSDTEATGQTFRSGGSNPKQVNVFIDGLSYKNDIIQGGAFMQDSSRGNPFPQNAVQEYKVLTQNYKAEYEKAAAAVISAVTKSGGNELSGDAFYLFQDKSMVTQDDFAKERGEAKAPYERNQYGLSIGGPIIQDKLQYFVSTEQNERDVISSVFRGTSWDSAPANIKSALSGYSTGTISAPLDEALYFAKLSWQPASAQTVDFSYHRRDEEEIRGFGGQRTKDGASDFQVITDAAVLRHQMVIGNALNEMSLTMQNLQWKDSAVNPGVPHFNYIGLLDVGSKDYQQDLGQDKIGLRDDYSFMADWLGGHTLKTGLSVNWMKYKFSKASFETPYYEFRSTEQWQTPYLARYGFGNPNLDFKNTQYGIYFQDDWTVAKNLTLNLGVRWDYETNMLNNNWKTPAAVVAGLNTSCRNYDTAVGGQNTWCIRDLFNVNNYISTGSNRKSYKGMVQPRLGFTWDPKGNGETVVFGGWGLYYDRVTLNDIYDEQFRHSYKQYTFCFTTDGTQPAGCSVPAIQWNPSYLTAAGLDGLIARGETPGPEIFLLGNDTRPPKSTQWTFGLRQKLGSWLAALSYANSRGSNGLAWSFGTLPPGTAFNDRWGNWVSIPGYGFIMRGYDLRKTEYDGYFLTLDKPYTASSGWGASFAYTYGKGYQNASLDEGAAFAFDFLPGEWPMFPANQDERHRVVMSGTVGLPFNFTLSSVISLGSGTPYGIPDASAGWDKFVMRFNAARPEKYDFIIPNAWAYRSVDLRLEWEAPPIADRFRIGVTAEAFNVFDFDNYTYSDWTSGFKPPAGETNANFGKPTGEYNTRRFQVGARLSF